MNKKVLLFVFCVNVSFCFGQDKTKDSTYVANIELDEVVVNARMPRVQTKGSVSKIQVANTVLSKMGTAIRMLSHTPGLHSVNDNIEVNGLGEPVYVLDGRRLSDAKELSTLQADNIKSIEIDRTPSVRYSPNGQPVVFISTIKHINDYMFLSVGDYLKQTRMFSDVGILNARGQYKKFSASLSYIAGKEGNENKETYFRDIYNDNAFSINQKRETPVTTLAHKVNFSADYLLNPKNRLGIYYFYQHSDEGNKAYGTNQTDWMGQEEWSDIERKGKSLGNIHSGTLQYVYSGNNYSLNISQEIASTDINHNTQTLESDANSSSLTKSHGNSRYTIYTTSIDNGFKLPGQISAMAGVLFNHVDSKARTNSEIPYLDSYNYVNDISVKESNPQAYLSLSKTFGKWTVMPAARFQYVHRTIGSVSGTDSEGSLFKQNFSTVCPVITIKYRPSDNWLFQFNYRRNLTQPDFAQLNSRLTYQDSLLYSKGNTELENETTDRYTLSSTWKDLTLSCVTPTIRIRL